MKMNKFFRPYVIFLILFALTIPALLPLFNKGFFPTQDYIYVSRIQQMDKSLKDGQFPVRWVSDFRYGEPLYNFYAPLVYYTGSIIKTFIPTYLDTTKILFGLGFLLSGLSMFFLGKRLFGIMGGLLSSSLYIYAPYHSVDVYVRGALAESWSLVFFPLIFLSAYSLSEKQTNKGVIFLSLSLAGLFFTHNIMTVLFMPFFLFWVAFLIWRNKKTKLLKKYFLALILGVGLAATFLLPAFFEKEFVQSKYLLQGYFDFRGHFVAIPQFFSTFWGYGASLWGAKDDMSFQVGLVHWAAIGISIVAALLFRKDKNVFLLNLFLAFSFLFSLFMQHNKSAPIWEAFSGVLAYTQFPWRFLGISIFFASILGGSLGYYLKNKFGLLIPIFIIAIIYVYLPIFHPASYYLDSIDKHYISEEDVLSQDGKLPKDYLPIWVKEIAFDKLTEPIAKEGKIESSDFNKRSNQASFKVKVFEDAAIEAPITYFPGWKVLANGKEIKMEEPSKLGLISFRLPKGEYDVKLKFTNTAVRGLGNLASIICLITIISLWKSKK